MALVRPRTYPVLRCPPAIAGGWPDAKRNADHQVCMTKRDTILAMSSAISVRLDPEAMKALAQLEATGVSRSEAIRRAILDSASRLRRRADLAAEVADLEADEDDRREMLEVAAFMESMRAPR